MLSKLRSLWRRSRVLPGVGRILAAADRFWWARTIRRADLVDLELVRAQSHGRRLNPRQAVRAYVQGGFRSGFVLNPLFVDGLVSAQLPDADRVPAMYAYLVADSAKIGTTIAWDAATYANAHPESQREFGGALAHVWRGLREGGTVQLRGDARVDAPALRRAALNALDDQQGRPAEDAAEKREEEAGLVFVVVLDQRDLDGRVLISVAQFLDEAPENFIAALDTRLAPPSIRVAAALLAMTDPRVRLSADLPPELTPGTIILRRDGGSQVTAETLLALQRAAADGSVMPLLLASDGTVAAAGIVVRGERGYPLLAGFPAEDAGALGAVVATRALFGPVTAERVGESTAPRVLNTQSVILSDDANRLDNIASIALPGVPDSGNVALARRLVLAGWSMQGPVIRSVEESFALPDGRVVPRLRWGLKTAAPAGPAGESWGDTHFARGLAAALERLGQYAAVDARRAALRPSCALDDVSVVLRGPHRIIPPTAGQRLLWIISHPDEISATELADFDHVFAASRSWSRSAASRFGREIEPLMQCTDATRFRPSGIERDGSIVFVGTARGIHRPAVVGPTRAGIPLRVYGPDWRGYIPAAQIAGTGIPNDELPARYESAGVVLNDHWPEMRRNGFISNRPYDVLAAGGRVISDDVEGLDEEFAGAVVTFRNEEDLVDKLGGDLDSLFPSQEELARIGDLVRERDSFDARARTLLEVALSSR